MNKSMWDKQRAEEVRFLRGDYREVETSSEEFCADGGAMNESFEVVLPYELANEILGHLVGLIELNGLDPVRLGYECAAYRNMYKLRNILFQVKGLGGKECDNQ